MPLDRFLRIGLASSVAVNMVAICFVGYAQTLKPAPPISAPIKKVAPPPTRLIEIQLPPEQLKKIGKELKSKGEGGEGQGQGVASGPLFDSKSGPEGKLGKGKVATAEKPQETPEVPEPLKTKAALTKQGFVAKAALEKKGAEQSRNIKVAIRANQKLDLKLVRLKRPGALKTGGYHGIVDLRKFKLTANLLAMLDKADAKLVRNKYIGKQHVEVIGKIGGNSVCIPTGGHTIYGSDLKIYLGKDIKLYGTKFCVPGGLPGIPGSASQTDPRQTVTSLNQSPASQGGGFTGQSEGKPDGTNVAQTGTPLDGYRPLHEAGGRASIEKGTRGNGQDDKDNLNQPAGGGGGFVGKGETKTDSHGAADVGDAAETSQRALQERYLKYASGALRGVPEAQSTARPLHLPQAGPQPNKEIPGVEVPKDQRKLVDDPKEHRGSSGGKESPDPVAPKPVKFVLNPSSVGSLSSNGDVLWAMASGKTHKGKATRKVKGHGKKDGGGDGTGLLGVYFRGDDLRQEVFRRADPVIDFDWTFQPLDKRMPVSTYFSARWTGEIRPKYSELYTIYIASDDGARIWIDGHLLISNWTDHSATEDVGLINFIAGHRYSIKVEYYANSITPSVMKLYWQSPHQVKEYIPQSCLFYPTAR